MIVYEGPWGRLGNIIFRYLTAALLRAKYGAKRGIYGEQIPIEYHNGNIIKITDENILDFIKCIEENEKLNENTVFLFEGYFQNDILCNYRDLLIDFINKNQNDILYGITPQKQKIVYYVKDLVVPLPSTPQYDIVIHIRLEDFLDDNIHNAIHPESLEKVIQDIIGNSGGEEVTKICLLCNKPTMEIEKLYIHYFTSRYNIIVESNDIYMDYHIMLGAKILVCSLSTLSWCAAVLSKNLKKVYIPKNKTTGAQHFSLPIENSILYDNHFCGETELREFFQIPDNVIMEVRENREKQEKRWKSLT